jgi:sugar phosphate isomerase/epimerase
LSRRSLLVSGAVAAAALVASRVPSASAALADVATVKHDDALKGLKIGVATYTFIRSAKTPEEAIKGIQRAGLSYCSIKDAHLPFKTTTEERKAIVEKFKAAGITPLSVGNITIPNDEAEIKRLFEYVRDVGVPVMVCAPKDLDALKASERYVKEFDIKMAIHNHGPEYKLFPSPDDVMRAADKMDERIGCCIDVGHTARAGTDPAAAILKYGPRVYDIHMKDIARLDRPSTVECGRGILDIKGILAALVKIKFAGNVGFEHEKDMQDPLPGLCEGVGYVRGILATM